MRFTLKEIYDTANHSGMASGLTSVQETLAEANEMAVKNGHELRLFYTAFDKFVWAKKDPDQSN